MSTRKPMEAFIEPEEDVVEEAPVEREVVAPGAPATKKGRVKGTWTMHWAGVNYPFVDGKTYTLPTDLYWYLRQNNAIYDTL
jgi:hypothetical protein